jgi:hypothetical protein
MKFNDKMYDFRTLINQKPRIRNFKAYLYEFLDLVFQISASPMHLKVPCGAFISPFYPLSARMAPSHVETKGLFLDFYQTSSLLLSQAVERQGFFLLGDSPRSQGIIQMP